MLREQCEWHKCGEKKKGEEWLTTCTNDINLLPSVNTIFLACSCIFMCVSIKGNFNTMFSSKHIMLDDPNSLALLYTWLQPWMCVCAGASTSTVAAPSSFFSGIVVVAEVSERPVKSMMGCCYART
jgi:hypothetical protein